MFYYHNIFINESTKMDIQKILFSLFLLPLSASEPGPAYLPASPAPKRSSYARVHAQKLVQQASATMLQRRTTSLTHNTGKESRFTPYGRLNYGNVTTLSQPEYTTSINPKVWIIGRAGWGELSSNMVSLLRNRGQLPSWSELITDMVVKKNMQESDRKADTPSVSSTDDSDAVQIISIGDSDTDEENG